jgi:hypothetical protein
VREVRVAGERHEACVREQGGELAPSGDGNRAIPTPVEHERRRSQAREIRPGVGVELEREERGGDLGVRRAPLVPAEGGDLVAACVREDEPREHLRRKRPVDPYEVDQ